MPVRPRSLSLLLVLGLAVLAHARGLGGAFVYDDHRFIEQNAALIPVRGLDYLLDPATASAASGAGVSVDIYRPLRTLLFALERAAFGLAPAGWHFVSLLLHAANAWLVLRLLRRLVGGEAAAVAGALVFAVHPVTVECVAWVSSQGDLLALTLMLGALAAFEGPGVRRTALGVVLGLLACLAKESAIVLPALLIVRDLSLDASQAPPRATTGMRTALLALGVAGYFLLRTAVMPGAMAQVEHPGFAEAVRGFLAATTWYAGSLLWPSGFRFETDLLAPLGWGEPSVVLGLGIWGTVLAAGFAAVRGGRPAALVFATFGAAAALGPVSQVLVPLKTLAAERFLYPVLPCAVAALAAGAAALGRRWGGAVAWTPLALAVPLTVVTLARTPAWHDEESLWRAVRRDRPWNARAYEGLGFALLDQGRWQEAERAYTSYFEANPWDGKAHYVFALHLESIARTLDATDPDVLRESDIRAKRRAVLHLTFLELARAVGIWDEVGLAAGRGSPAMLEDALRRTCDAALAYGDLGQARVANDRLLALAGFEPSDAARVMREGPLPLRLMRWFLAWLEATSPPADVPPAVREQHLRVRADVLRDAGLDPEKGNDLIVVALEAPLGGLVAAAEAAHRGLTPGPARATAFGVLTKLWGLQAELLVATGRPEEARRVLGEAHRRRLAEPLAGGP